MTNETGPTPPVAHALLAKTARITTHLPALTEPFTAERLPALAQHSGVLLSDVPQVLFVCVHNAGRARWSPPCSSTTPKAASTSAAPAARPPRASTPRSPR